jgi:ribosome biogenesis GTPase / thiamine phosphate phosphatase
LAEIVEDNLDAVSTISLSDLGWSDFFQDQLGPEQADLAAMRIATVHRARVTAISEAGPVALTLPARIDTSDLAVGDWILADPRTHLLCRQLSRKTVLTRRTDSQSRHQLAAANVDTLFIVTSCNSEFNVARLERYLTLANQAGVTPVVVLTKADATADVGYYVRQACALQRSLPVVILDPRSTDVLTGLRPWCGKGQTVALVGSSGVGKSTLVNSLAGPAQKLPQETGAVREHDAKGRHTTTSRSIHAIEGGGWVIDTPGIRTLHVSDADRGIETLFAEITELAPSCKFRDCTHTEEPGCAVLAAASEGRLDVERLARWRKLSEENTSNTPVESWPRSGKSTKSRGTGHHGSSAECGPLRKR